MFLLVDGLPGMGTTTLLRELAGLMERRYGWTAIHSRADRFEREEPYSFMERLFAGELAGGWAFEAQPDADPVELARECLNRILEDAPETGQAVIIDDAQWIDEASARILRYLLPRLIRRRTLIAFGARKPHERGSLGEYLERLSRDPNGGRIDLQPLTDQEIRAIAVSRFGTDIMRRNARALREATGGSLRHVDAFFDTLDPSEAAALHLVWDLPVRGPSPEDNPMLVQYRSLGPAARTAVEVVALAGSGIEAGALESVLARSGEESGLGDAIDRGVLRESGFGSRIAPHHELLVPAVRAMLAPERRRRLARDLAAVDGPRLDYLLAAAEELDAELLDRVVEHADAAVARGEIREADAVLRRALELAPEPNARAELLVRMDLLIRLAMAHLRAKTPFHLLDLLPEYARLPATGLRDALLVMIEAFRVDAPFPHERVARMTAEPAPDPDGRALQASLALLAVVRTLRSGDLSPLAERIERARRCFEAAPKDPGELRDPRLAGLVEPDAPLLDCYALASAPHRATKGAVARLIERTQALPEGPVKADALAAIAGTLAGSGAFARAAELAHDAMRIVDAGHAPWGLGTVLLVRAHSLVMLGRYQEARKVAGIMEERCEDALDVETRPLAAALRAFIGAGAGGEDLGPLLAQARRHREIEWESYAPDLAIIAECEAARADGDFEAVLRASEGPYVERIRNTRHGFLTYRAQALVRLGRLEDARRLINRLETWRGARWLECWGSLAWLRALLAAARDDRNSAIRHFEEAAAETAPPVPCALALLDYGEFLVAEERHDAARSALMRAAALLRSSGAERYLARVRGTMAALDAPRSTRDRLLDTLTSREREIAERLAEGESNRQIAEALVVSQATVRFHVSNVLRKLQVSSRGEAGSLLRGPAVSERSGR
ncbi:regulatory protein, LuxR [Gulosibacter sp. 10]|nr:regulatory protein, LuxR [Gulosibacter sp. 10]